MRFRVFWAFALTDWRDSSSRSGARCSASYKLYRLTAVRCRWCFCLALGLPLRTLARSQARLENVRRAAEMVPALRTMHIIARGRVMENMTSQPRPRRPAPVHRPLMRLRADGMRHQSRLSSCGCCCGGQGRKLALLGTRPSRSTHKRAMRYIPWHGPPAATALSPLPEICRRRTNVPTGDRHVGHAFSSSYGLPTARRRHTNPPVAEYPLQEAGGSRHPRFTFPLAKRGAPVRFHVGDGLSRGEQPHSAADGRCGRATLDAPPRGLRSAKLGAQTARALADRPGVLPAPSSPRFLTVSLDPCFVLILSSNLAACRGGEGRQTDGRLAPPLWHRHSTGLGHGTLPAEPPHSAYQMDQSRGDCAPCYALSPLFLIEKRPRLF